MLNLRCDFAGLSEILAPYTQVELLASTMGFYVLQAFLSINLRISFAFLTSDFSGE